MAISDPNADIEVKLVWSCDGLGEISEQLYVSMLQIASAAEQSEAVRNWCHAGGIYKSAGRVGVALMDPDANAEIKLMWSGDGRGEHSKLLKAATLQVASAEDQKEAVKAWFGVGAVCKFNGKVGIATSDLDSDAQTTLMWYDGEGTLSQPIQAVRLLLASMSSQHSAVAAWCHNGGVYHHHGRVGVATSDPSITNEVQLVWLDDGLFKVSKVLNADISMDASLS